MKFDRNDKGLYLIFLLILGVFGNMAGQTFDKFRFAVTQGGYPFLPMTKDLNGNIFVASNAWGPLYIDYLGYSTSYANDYDIIVKFNSDMQVVWLKQLQCDASFGTDQFNCIATDEDGNLYVGVGLSGSDLSIDQDTSLNIATVYHILKFNSAGKFIQIKPYNGPFSFVCIKNSLYVSSEHFVEKLDQNLNQVWMKSIDACVTFSEHPYFQNISYNNSAELCLNGIENTNFCGTPIHFDTVQAILSPGLANEVVTIKMDTNGIAFWMKAWGGLTNAQKQVVESAIGDDGTIYIAIEDIGINIFGSDTMQNPFTTNLNYSAILKYNSSGVEKSALPISSASFSAMKSIKSLILDHDQNLLFSGFVLDSGRAGVQSLLGGEYLVKYDSLFHMQWVKYISGNNTMIISDSLDGYTIGGFHRDTTFDCYLSTGIGFYLAHLNNSTIGPVQSTFNYTIQNDTIVFQNLSQNAEYYYWDFGDGSSSNDINPVHIYSNAGNYIVSLIVFRGECTDSSFMTISLVSTDEIQKRKLVISPSPASKIIHLTNLNDLSYYQIVIVDLYGRVIWDMNKENHSSTGGIINLDISNFPSGMYVLRINSDFKNVVEEKIIVLN